PGVSNRYTAARRPVLRIRLTHVLVSDREARPPRIHDLGGTGASTRRDRRSDRTLGGPRGVVAARTSRTPEVHSSSGERDRALFTRGHVHASRTVLGGRIRNQRFSGNEWKVGFPHSGLPRAPV